MVNPAAVFDCLATGKRLQDAFGYFTRSELHLFSYLGCLLWLYFERRPVADWGYPFFGTPLGAPFSRDLEDAILDLPRCGFLQGDQSHLQLTDGGVAEFEELRQLTFTGERDRFIDGACNSALTLPLGLLRTSLANEPELQRAAALASTRTLLQEDALSALYEHFDVLTKVMGSEHQPVVVASVWLWAMAGRQITKDAG